MEKLLSEETRIDNLLTEILEINRSISNTAEDYLLRLRTESGKEIPAEYNEVFTDDRGIDLYYSVNDDALTLIHISKEKKVCYWERISETQHTEGENVRITSAEDLIALKQLLQSECE